MRHKKSKPGQELRLAKKMPLSSSEFSYLSTASLFCLPNFHLYRSRWSNRRLRDPECAAVAFQLIRELCRFLVCPKMGPMLPKVAGHSPGDGSHLNVISITNLCPGMKEVGESGVA